MHRPSPSLTHRRLWAAAAVLLAAPVAAQQAYPNRPVTMISSFSVGSGPDTVLRLVAEKLGGMWGQRVVVENRPGGAGFIAIDGFRRAAPDGHTLLQLDSEQLAALPFLYKQRNYDPDAIFEYTAGLFRTFFMVSTASGSPWRSVADLIAAARREPGSVTYGSWGIGSPGHLGGVALESATQVKMLHVPYKETPQLFASVGNGDVAWSFATLASSQGAYQAGKIRYLAVAAPKRISQFPDVPTVSESGGPAGLEVSSFAAILAPKGTPQSIVDKINADINKVLGDPAIQARFATFAFEPTPWTPAEIKSEVKNKFDVYRQSIEKANIRLD